MMFVRSNTNSYWLSGMPIMSQMIARGRAAATSVTKSTVPFSRSRSTISVARRSTDSWRSLRCRGVKPRETMRRRRAWRGSSMLIMEPKKSRNGSGMSPMFEPLPEQNSSG